MASQPVGSGGAAAPAPAASAKATPKDIWNMLESAGASSVQAAAIMGNAIAESSLNPEAQVTDSNGYLSSGLWQFNAQSYPGSPSLVTGNPMKDAEAQVAFLAQVGGFKAASGATPSQAASNFAANFERCSTCAAGQTSNEQRAANANTVAGWATSDNWPASAGTASDSATLTSASTAAASAACLISWPSASVLPFGIGPTFGGGCIFARSEARALVGGILLGVGGLGLLTGVIILAASAFAGSKFAGRAADVAAVVPGAGAVAAGLQGVQNRASQGGAGVVGQRQAATRQQAAQARQPRGRHARPGANAPARGRHARPASGEA